MVLALWSAGCFRYTRIEPAAAPAEEELRVRVTREAAVRVGSQLGRLSEQYEGRLEPLGTDSVILAVWIGKDYIGSPFENTRQRVSLVPGEIVEVRRRTLDVRRTALAAAAVIAVTGAVIGTVVTEGDPNLGDPGGPYQPPVDFRIPLFRISW
jgi:hypothetical protein